MSAQAKEERSLKEFDHKDISSLLRYIQVNMKVPKNQTNSFGGYKFRNSEDILEELKKYFPKDAYLTIDDSIELIGDRYYVKSCVKLYYKEKTIEASAYAREAIIKKGMDESQITGSCSSYARKYALSGLFLLDDSKDSDSTNNDEQLNITNKKEYNKMREMSNPINEKLSLLKELNDIIASKEVSESTITKWKDYYKVDNLNKLNESQIKVLISRINKVYVEEK